MTFKTDELIRLLPRLRAYARSLCHDQVRADDLVQSAIVKALAGEHLFETDTNLYAWVCTILKNVYLSEKRKGRREIEDIDGKIGVQVVTPEPQHDHVYLAEVMGVMEELPFQQREALMLVGIYGYSYEQAADFLGVEIGTVKSRVNRARVYLCDRLGESQPHQGQEDDVSRDLSSEEAWKHLVAMGGLDGVDEFDDEQPRH